MSSRKYGSSKTERQVRKRRRVEWMESRRRVDSRGLKKERCGFKSGVLLGFGDDWFILLCCVLWCWLLAPPGLVFRFAAFTAATRTLSPYIIQFWVQPFVRLFHSISVLAASRVPVATRQRTLQAFRHSHRSISSSLLSLLRLSSRYQQQPAPPALTLCPHRLLATLLGRASLSSLVSDFDRPSVPHVRVSIQRMQSIDHDDMPLLPLHDTSFDIVRRHRAWSAVRMEGE